MVTQDSEISAAKTAGFAAKNRRCRMIALNVILSLIIQSKRKGKGIISNGKIYSSLMLCISDHRSESDLLNCFNNEAVPIGGIVDFENDNFMDENFRESVLPWIKPLPQSR